MTDMLLFEPEPHQWAYTFGGAPAYAEIPPRQPVRVWSQDCFGGAVRTVDDLPSQVCRFPYLNPVTGPFLVPGARPGDILAVHLVSLTPARGWGMSATFPHFGALTSTGHTATLQPPLQERVWRYDIDLATGTVRYAARRSDLVVDLPLEPMIGTIGVAPAAGEVRMSIVPDSHGGNLDCPQIGPGTTVYLPVHVDGALFALGDGHARQGDGEACGVAVECAMDTVLIVDVITGEPPLGWPRFETDTTLASIGAARPLEDAYRVSHHDLVTWVAQLTGLDALDAYQLVSQAGRAPIGNVCDPNYTIAAEILKRYLPGADAYHGVHQRLRRLGAELR